MPYALRRYIAGVDFVGSCLLNNLMLGLSREIFLFVSSDNDTNFSGMHALIFSDYFVCKVLRNRANVYEILKNYHAINQALQKELTCREAFSYNTSNQNGSLRQIVVFIEAKI
mmetsp:Transcript_4545/g.11729  ORF Transcript_4545/g.11729 Transcript_4545/m.11729 type:complete len:113 (-) Transcript_4545:166-504(-)